MGLTTQPDILDGIENDFLQSYGNALPLWKIIEKRESRTSICTQTKIKVRTKTTQPLKDKDQGTNEDTLLVSGEDVMIGLLKCL